MVYLRKGKDDWSRVYFVCIDPISNALWVLRGRWYSRHGHFGS